MRSHQGGIYRNVRLIRKSDKAYIRWNGVRVTTPGLAENQGRASIVQVDVDIENQGRFVRLTFLAGSTPKLSEITVKGYIQ